MPGAVIQSIPVGVVQLTPLYSINASTLFTNATTLPLWGINSHATIDDDGAHPISGATNTAVCQALGATVLRMDICDWPDIETSKGVYSFPHDSSITGVTTAGITVSVVFAYSNTLYESSYYTGPADATGRTAFVNYANTCVAHYGTSNFIFEIWNEENISNGAGQYSWAPAASTTNYSALVNAAVPAIIASNSSAQIITGGLSPGGGSGFIDPDTFVAAIASDITVWSDLAGIGFHPYSYSGNTPDIFTSLCSSFVSSAGNGKPIYANEVGAPTGSYQAPTEALKAVVIAETLGSAIISQVYMCCIYEAISNTGFGLFSWVDTGGGTFTYSALPAATAMAAITTACAGTTSFDAAEISTVPLYQITLHKSGSHTHIVWVGQGSTWPPSSAYTYNLTEASPPSHVTATDTQNNSVPVAVAGNVVSFDVYGAVGPVIVNVTP